MLVDDLKLEEKVYAPPTDVQPKENYQPSSCKKPEEKGGSDEELNFITIQSPRTSPLHSACAPPGPCCSAGTISPQNLRPSPASPPLFTKSDESDNADGDVVEEHENVDG